MGRVGIRQNDIVEVTGAAEPYVILSGNAYHASGNVLVVPLVSDLKRLVGNIIMYPSEQNNLTEPAEVMIGNITTASQNVCKRKIGVITDNQREAILTGLDMILDR